LAPPHPCQPEGQGCPKHTTSVNHATAKVNRRGFGKIPGWARNFANPVAVPDELGEHLVIKKEIVGILVERQLFQ
jgi:hypothetical protein